MSKLFERIQLKLNKKNHSDKKTMEKQNSDEALFDKLEGPYIQIKGDFNSPVDVRVINPSSSSRNSSTKPSKARIICDQDLRDKVGNFGSPTVCSRQYDLNGSWVCVFCNQATHWEGLGDLFGPYWVPSTRMKTTKRKPELVEVASGHVGGADEGEHSEVANEHVGGADEDEHSDKAIEEVAGFTEIWFHCDCLCWVPCVYLVGSKLVGLEEAVEQTRDTVCCGCGSRGASVGCCSAGCREKAHLGCAMREGWALDINTFIATCTGHKQ